MLLHSVVLPGHTLHATDYLLQLECFEPVTNHMPVMQGVFDHLESKGITPPTPVGLQVMLHGVVPLGNVF